MQNNSEIDKNLAVEIHRLEMQIASTMVAYNSELDTLHQQLGEAKKMLNKQKLALRQK